jgi:hypothetical protein
VIARTACGWGLLYLEIAKEAEFPMDASQTQLNRFERVLFRVAFGVGAILITVRLAAVVVVWYLRHIR